jgi:hypothetical protein
MKKSLAYLLVIAAMSFTLGLAAQDKQDPKKKDDPVAEGQRRGDAEAQQYHEQQGQKDADNAAKENANKDDKKDDKKNN